ncbi:MAG: DEAD/DEAH box helicase [Emcibacter sp.]|nr:DEAD/DEAH box helicase [Emcibacter sp.]
MTHDNAPTIDESGIDESGFNEFGLADTILKSIDREGFSSPTKIQVMAIPPLMEGNDLIGIAQTGGGKTAAFSLPTINKLLEDYVRPRQNMPKVLILAPTRELAMQIEQCIVTFSRGTKISSLVVAGGQPYPPQTNKLRRGVDILVATPGRLIDHINRRNIKFDDTNIFVLDEADRMLDMGFIDDVQDIANSLPEGHQTILFSATMNPKVRNLTRSLLKDPVNVEIKQKTAVADTITHKLMNVSRKNKAKLLAQILSGENVDKALVFARTKIGADNLCGLLQDEGIQSDAIHGDKRQRVREKILMNFRRGRTKVLVATDVAARGIDVDGISHVVNFELPIEPENYIHRVGRTGRAGQKGIAISFCDPSDVRLLVHIERLIKQPIDVDVDHEFHIDVTARGKSAGNQGRFSKRRSGANDRGGRKEGGFGRGFKREGQKLGGFKRDDRADTGSYRDNRAKSDRSQPRDKARLEKSSENRPARKFENNDWKKDATRTDRKEGGYNKTSRGSRDGGYKKQDRPARNDAPRYDPWTAQAKKYSDDPVLENLIGKPPKIDSKKDSKSDFVRAGDKKKPFKKKDSKSFTKSLDGKKASGGKKKNASSVSGKRSQKSYKPKGKNGAGDKGGTKAFSPKRKTLRPSRAA